MKNKIFALIILVVLNSTYTYQLKNLWLSPSNSYTLYLDQNTNSAMSDSLVSNPRIDFKFTTCVDSLRVQPVDSLPEIIAGATGTNTPRLCYSKYFLNMNNNPDSLAKDAYGVSVPINYPQDLTGMFDSFMITLNECAFYPWDKNGGGHLEVVNGDTIKVGGVDINTVFRHELGHICLDHEPSTFELDTINGEGKDSYEAIRTLMNDGTVLSYDSFPNYEYGQQERSGFKAVYAQPLLRIKDNPDKVIAIGDSIIFEIEGQVDTRNNLRSDSLFHCYLKYPYNLYPDTAGYHIAQISGYEIQVEIPDLIEWVSTDTYIAKSKFTFKPDSVGTYKFKVYTAMVWNQSGSLDLYEYYPEQVRPYSEVTFTVVPARPNFEYFKYKQTGEKENMYTTVHEIGAVYGTFNEAGAWKDGIVNEIKFYYKYPEETEYTDIPAAVETIVDEYKLYNTELDTGERKDSVRIKVEVTTMVDEQSVKITNEKTFELIDRYLIIDEPKPVGLGFVDFESNGDTNYQSIGRIMAEEGFDINRYLNSFIDHRTYDITGELLDIQTPTDTIPTDIYNWPKFYEESQEVNPVKNIVPKEGGVCCEPVNFSNEAAGKELSVYNESNIFASKIINCKPGKYTEKVRSFDYNWSTAIELTHGEKQDFLIPDWKLKTYGADYRFVPPSEKRDFAGINDNIPLCVWRPAVSGEVIPAKSKLNATVINAYKEGSTTSIYNNATVCEPEISQVVIWPTIDDTAGFYKVEGIETDILTGAEVKHTTEIQICPLYEHWEYGGDFSPNWDSGYDAGFWGIHGVNAINFATSENLRFYYLEAKYDTEVGGSSELTSATVNLGEYDNYNVQFDFQIGYPAHTIDPVTENLLYDKLFADYKVAVSKDGGSNWTIMATAKSSDLSIGPIYGHTFKSYFFNLGKSSEVTAVKVKLILDGIWLSPEGEDPILQTVGFDEIVVKYYKGPVLESPSNVAASVGSMGKNTANNSVYLTWSPPQKNKLEYEIIYYNIWRNGIKIGSVPGGVLSYTDTEINTGGKYNYAVVAAYDIPKDLLCEGANTLTSLLECNLWVDLSLYPRPTLGDVIAGTGTEYNNVTLTWTPPVCNLEITGYKIYRDDEYIGMTADTTYTDCFLEAGDYSYNVSAIFINPQGETLSSESKSVTVESDMPLPVLEDFEEVYDLPANWTIDEMPSDPFINWQIVYEHPREDLNLTESGCFAYTGSDSDHGTLGSQIFNKLISPVYNFSGIAQVTVSYDYFISKYASNAMEFKLYIKNVTTGSMTLLHTPLMADMSDWERSPDISVPENYMDCNCQFIFEVITYSTQFIPETGLNIYKGSVSVDNFEIIDTGRALLTPANVNISNNQGTMEITWDAVTGATQYYIYRSLLPDKNYQEIGSSATTTYDDVLTASDDCVYFYKVVSEVAQKTNNAKRGGIIKQTNKVLEAVK
ncbi:MAG: hypothetical protein A2Y39_05685 [Candidatus Delongbacteria bacterium GWF2_40_14]|nr:MAG: hypothetical protein A2Y39_05685 [Candidatus Delongbacteria bacterium GWF2_40_14]